MLLTNAGLFKIALSISKSFDVPYRIVFEALTKKCGNLSKHSEPVAWKWLIENELQGSSCSNFCCHFLLYTHNFLDLPMSTKGPATAAWNLLQELVSEYEEDKMSVIHKIVCKQIIKMHMFIPQWLLASYKVNVGRNYGVNI